MSSHEQKRATMLASVEKKTGRSLGAWGELLRREGPSGRAERVTWLKTEQGVGHFYAQLIARETADRA